MELLERMNRAVEYIETNLTNKIGYEKVANEIGYSIHHFQRMFSFITDISMAEYVRRRRMTMAAFELQNSSMKVIDIALKYGYESPEAFARAFQNLHGITPTVARNKGIGLKAYPRISFQISIKGVSEMKYRIETRKDFQVYGIERIFDISNDENLREIPRFWNEVLSNGECDKLAESTGNLNNQGELCPVNAVCDYKKTEGTTFPYMIYALKSNKSDTRGYKVVEVPSATWAIFTSEEYDMGDVSIAFQDLNKRAHTEWLPTSTYNKLEGYDLEMYYEKSNGKGYCESWIRVESKVE
ncbi:MAG: helix-turn-helix domain-containing protein [Clostridium sp.]